MSDDKAYININPFCFDSQPEEGIPNIFYGLECEMLEIDCSDPSGTDCLVAYKFESKEDALAKFQIRDASWTMIHVDSIWTNDCYAIPEGVEVPENWLITPEERKNLKGKTVKAKIALTNAELNDFLNSVTSYENAVDAGGDLNWYEESHLPYKRERLQTVIANNV